jgi:ABC-2 type transport system ATP-binding protein
MQLFVRFAAGELPQELRALEVEPAAPGARQHLLRLSSYDEVERILAQCRAAGCTFDEIEVRKADLEDVFVQVMNGPEVVEGLA